MDIRELMSELNPDAYLLPDMDEALVGIAWRFGTPQVACYDHDRCREILMGRGMHRDEAEQHLMWVIMAHKPAAVEHPDAMPIYLSRF